MVFDKAAHLLKVFRTGILRFGELSSISQLLTLLP
jgi:hypothetical protein